MSPISYHLKDGLPWSLQALLLIIFLVGNFFPFYITLAVFAVIFTILASSGHFTEAFTNLKQSDILLWILIFYLYTTSTIFRNWLGVLITTAFLLGYLFFSYYKKSMKPYFYEDLLNICLIASFILFIFALLEKYNFIREWDYTFISQAMSKTHWDRVETTFFNPNYYAMMLEFFFMIGLYKMNRSQKIRKKLTFGVITLCNLIAIIYTGSRTSYAVIIGAILVYFYILGYKKQAITASGLMIVALLFMIANQNIPRMDSLSWALEDRTHIWKSACQIIQDNLFFGQGPLSYFYLCKNYPLAKLTYHAHNLFLNIILDFGLVGTSLLIYPLIRYGIMINEMRSYPKLRRRLALIMSFIAITFLHGLTDVTILWIQTSFIFLIVVLPIPNMLKEVKEMH